MPLDPEHWNWGRLLALSAVWAGAVLCAGMVLFWRAMERAKETQAAGGDFVTPLPYGTRHLAILVAIAAGPPLLALLRKALAG